MTEPGKPFTNEWMVAIFQYGKCCGSAADYIETFEEADKLAQRLNMKNPYHNCYCAPLKITELLGWDPNADPIPPPERWTIIKVGDFLAPPGGKAANDL
jgi:hypothetical protein